MNSMVISNTAMRELSEDEVLEINGGLTFLVAAAGVAAGFALFNAAHSAGESVGKAIYNMTH